MKIILEISNFLKIKKFEKLSKLFGGPKLCFMCFSVMCLVWIVCVMMFVKTNRLERPKMLCDLTSPVAEATEGGLKALVGLMGKCSCLEVSGYYGMESMAIWVVILSTPFGFVELVV